MTVLLTWCANVTHAAEFVTQARVDIQRGAAYAVSAPSDSVTARAWATAWLTDRFALTAKAHGAWSDAAWYGGEANVTFAPSVLWLTAGYQRLQAEQGRNLVFGAVSYRLAADHFASVTLYRDLTAKLTLIEGEADYALPIARRTAWYLAGRANWLSDGAFAAMYQGEAVLGVRWQIVTRPIVTLTPYIGYTKALSGEAEERIQAGGASANGGRFGLRVNAWF